MKKDIIHESENKIAWYCDILKETTDTITYSELIIPHEDKAIIPGMTYDEYVDIKKSNLKNLTYEQIHLYLRNIQPDEKEKISRLDMFKIFLNNKEITFESDLFT